MDNVIVHVTNHIEPHGLSIHWHGMFQRGTPWADGVNMITQCPIHTPSSWIYSFIADPPGEASIYFFLDSDLYISFAFF